jgi:hypothetical protein
MELPLLDIYRWHALCVRLKSNRRCRWFSLALVLQGRVYF